VIFLLIISYSILIAMLLAFIVFAVKVKNTMVNINDQINEMRSDVNDVKKLYHTEITDLIRSIKGIIK
jgi:hypothetical protein